MSFDKKDGRVLLAPRARSRFCRSVASVTLCLLAALRPLFGAAYFPPSPRPDDIAEADWQDLFKGRPVVIIAHVVTAKGISWYDIHDWDKSLKFGGIGTNEFYVKVENGTVDMPWFLCFPQDAYSGKRTPSWTSLGLSLSEATEMVKQEMRKMIQQDGFEEYRQIIQKDYERLARGVGFDANYELLYPEWIEASKELGLIPKNYVPRVADTPHFTKEEIEAAVRARDVARARWAAEKKAKEEQKRKQNPPASAQQP